MLCNLESIPLRTCKISVIAIQEKEVDMTLLVDGLNGVVSTTEVDECLGSCIQARNGPCRPYTHRVRQIASLNALGLGSSQVTRKFSGSTLQYMHGLLIAPFVCVQEGT